MRSIWFVASVVPALLGAGCSSCAPADEPRCQGSEALPERGFFCPLGGNVAAYVDPMIGTDGSGNAIPGAMVPHGMVKLSPDTNAGAGSVDGYDYGDDKIEGFSHTHLEGPGGGNNGYSHILLMPGVGRIDPSVEAYASSYSHEDEVASPGYYAVTLEDTSVRVELTASAHAGLHRYTFPASDEAHVLLDVGHSRGYSQDGELRVVDDRRLEGHGVYNVHPLLNFAMQTYGSDYETGRSVVYFAVEFSRPFTGHGTWQEGEERPLVTPGSDRAEGPEIGGYFQFGTEADAVVEARVGISFVSVAQARRNLDAELEGRSFDDVRSEARAAWSCLLNRVKVEGGTAEERTLFYTSLYHSAMQPTDYVEVGGSFHSAADGVGAVFHWPGRRFLSDDWCVWDTFRTSHPLATLVEPETVDDRVASFLHLYEQGGWLPKCTWHASGYSRVMIGNHAAAVIADAAVKGFECYDPDVAWAALHKSATDEDNRFLIRGLCGYLNLGVPPEYLELGYVSTECDGTQSVSMTLEYAYDDWATAQVARLQGREDEAARFLDRAQGYRHHWDPEVGFMRGRNYDGAWASGFSPTSESYFCEANSWIYTWFVPHDVPGLISLVGGDEAFVEKLDRFFDEGHFEIDNEPSFHVPYLYSFAGAPEKTQARVREVLASEFSATPDGLPGNDDAGATSAWYVLSAMGLYPVAPGDGRYQITSPLFDRIAIALHPAFSGPSARFVIEAENNSAENRYIQAAALNGEPLDRPVISHDQIVGGGTLVLEMGPRPSTWGR